MSNENNHQQAQMLRGTAWLTASNFISRLLGAIYIIPWYIWMGSYAATANGLFTMGYNIYACSCWFQQRVFQLRLPSKWPSTIPCEKKSIALPDSELFGLYDRTRSCFCTSLVCLCSLASRLIWRGQRLNPNHAELGLGGLDFPSMSVIRGFSKGVNNLKPYAMSQIAEQVIRVIWMLLATFIIMKMAQEII